MSICPYICLYISSYEDDVYISSYKDGVCVCVCYISLSCIYMYIYKIYDKLEHFEPKPNKKILSSKVSKRNFQFTL